MAEQIDWRAKQPSQVVCFSEDLKCWEAWNTTCWILFYDEVTWHGAWLYGVHTERAEMAVVSHGTSHVTVKERCKYTTSVDIQKRAIKR